MTKVNLNLFIILINVCFLFFHKTSIAGINNSEEIIKWERLSKDSFIDTKDFKVTKKSLELNVKSKGYNEVLLNIDCENLIYKKKYGDKETIYKPILIKTSEYNIAKNLCFLTGVNGFYKDKRPDSWARIIIKRFEENTPRYLKSKNSLINSEITNKKEDLKDKNNNKDKELTSTEDY